MDTLFLAQIDNLLLWQRRMVFNLVDRWDNRGFGQQLFQILHTVIGNSDGLGLAGLGNFLKFLPSLRVGPVCEEIAGTVGMFGEFLIIS